MQSSDTSIRPVLAFPVGRERRRGNHAEERVKGTGEVGVRAGPGHGAREEAPWRGEKEAESGARTAPRSHSCTHSERAEGTGSRGGGSLGHQRLGAH